MATEAVSASDDQNDNNNHDSQSSPSPPPPAKKRSSGAAHLDANGNPKPVKRRATKACAACRARKVRCDVMQRYHITADGEVTCSNCTMDGIKCVIGESKRRKISEDDVDQTLPHAQTWPNGLINPTDIVSSENRRWSDSTAMSNDVPASNDFSASQHVPHSIYQNVHQQITQGEIPQRQNFLAPSFEVDPTYTLLKSASIHGDRTATRLAPPPAPFLKHVLPGYLKPLPQRMTSADIDYLFAKGALSLPDIPVRNALFRSYFEFVHPYMPLVEIHELLDIVEEGTGASGRISLLLFQAIMFAGTAFVDMEYLRAAGYTNRKVARKAFFQKARVLYDFDYELDRVSLVQSLLLMTYWYETPDDQKDTWHWMGVAISLAHTIGLHRNPENSTMEPRKKKLWKRIWWSCFMRDRLIALGMRRPTRVKDEDYDVPMLTESDFEIGPVAEHITVIAPECSLAKDVGAQRQLAQMCIAKAKLCLCVSHVLSAQYSVLVRCQGMQGVEGATRSSVMLFPKKLDQTDEVRNCDLELSQWIAELPEACQYSNELGVGNSAPSLFVNRALLNMAYFTTLSALHRPQVLPSPTTTKPDSSRELQDTSRRKVREASREITRISQDLHSHGLEKYLPTTGVTVLLPAIIIHLLDIKSCNDDARQAAMDGFCQCMLVLEKLRDIYASADFATQFLEAAIRKADIDVTMRPSRDKFRQENNPPPSALNLEKANELHRRSQAARWTPPLSDDHGPAFAPSSMHMGDIRIPTGDAATNINDSNIHNSITARTPESEDAGSSFPKSILDFTSGGNTTGGVSAGDVDLNDFLTFDNTNELWTVPLEEGAHGESGGFVGDMNWVDQGTGWMSPSPDIVLQDGFEDMRVQETMV
ncbi:hypothetical protein OIDMADRAFT_170745 [Oidiodendron maius Zn]|uniref:Zn(2)-C6 fungal-type domain-containing protein n=1 Tax=Oidiodendron maius (strain Zn) TaxID=913774 RepID=A0A0C3D2F0_OIDMZ|nr:hypothetical protein OIDMADRAFT_170745 [Oidiodendron maius Zn]